MLADPTVVISAHRELLKCLYTVILVTNQSSVLGELWLLSTALLVSLFSLTGDRCRCHSDRCLLLSTTWRALVARLNLARY